MESKIKIDIDVIVKHDVYFCCLLVLDEENLLLVSGEAGVGKTALLCHWLKTLQAEDSSRVVIYHFVGASPLSAGKDFRLYTIIIVWAIYK